MLASKCYLKDIREWEEKHQINLLSLFEKVSINNLIGILQVFYKDATDEQFCEMLDNYFINEGHSIDEAFIELRNALLGYKETDKDVNNQEENDVTGSYEDVTQYKFLTDFYMHLGMQLMSMGVTYSEFWSLTTAEMYQVFNAIQQKSIMDFNKNMNEYHILAGLIGAGVWGKLPKDAPHINIEDLQDPDEIINTPLGEMTRADYKSAVALQSMFIKNDAMQGGNNNG